MLEGQRQVSSRTGPLARMVSRHRLEWFIQLRAQGRDEEDERPAYAPRGVRHSWRSLPLSLCRIAYTVTLS